MQVTIQDTGDRSVGINPGEVRIEWEGLEQWIDECDRRLLRSELQEMFSRWMDGKVSVVFSDVCPVCGNAGYVESVCSNPKCIQNDSSED